MTATVKQDLLRSQNFSQRYTMVGLAWAAGFHLSVIIVYILVELLIPEKIVSPYWRSGCVFDIHPGFIIPKSDGMGKQVISSLKIPSGHYVPVAFTDVRPDSFKDILPGENPADVIGTGDDLGVSNGSSGSGGDFTGSLEEPDPEPTVFRVLEKEPIPIKQVAPIYPDLGRRSGLEGTVWVKCLVDKEGKVKKTLVLKSDNEIFIEPSLDAATQWLFTPAISNGTIVKVWVSIPFKFALKK